MNITESFDRPFRSISEAIRLTGFSGHYLRQGLKNGTIPHIMTGNKYMVNIPALLEKLDAESRQVGAANK